MSDKILVTGGCGFVGANLVRKLLDEGFDVVVLDNLSRGRKEYLDGLGIPIIEGDIRNQSEIAHVFNSVDKVVHFAAYGSVVESVEDPQANFEINVMDNKSKKPLIKRSNPNLVTPYLRS